MGVVYVAEDTHLGRRVAVKFSTASPENTQFRARFLLEARAASALNHPHIAGIYDYGETPEGHPFIVMELVSGEDLYQVLRSGPMPVGQSLRIVEQAAEALGEAHRQGIAHRDIKPSNIVLGERGEVKVLDFGLAKQMQEAFHEADAGNFAAVILSNENGLTPADEYTYRSLVDRLKSDTKNVTSIQDFVHIPELREVMTSKDQKAWNLPVSMVGTMGTPAGQEAYRQVLQKVKDATANSSLQVNVVGGATTCEDMNLIGARDQHLIETATVVLVFGILILVYRSLVAMIMPLIGTR